MTGTATHSQVVEGALAEARLRSARSDRDLAADVAHLESVLTDVCRTWELIAVGWFAGGAGMPTLDVVRTDGTPGVLKIAVPGELDPAARVMQAADGVGYARVLRWDPGAGALLSERLGPDLWSAHTALADQAKVVAPVLHEAWQVPLSHGRSFEGKAAGLVAILDDLGAPYGVDHPDALRLAITWARDLAATERPEVVCHGDPHGGNVLARGCGWALIDPDGFVGERAYDLGVVVRDACRELASAEAASPGSGAPLLRNACRLLAHAAGVDEERVWRWGFVERVTTGLYLAWHGYADESTTFLGTASLLARET